MSSEGVEKVAGYPACGAVLFPGTVMISWERIDLGRLLLKPSWCNSGMEVSKFCPEQKFVGEYNGLPRFHRPLLQKIFGWDRVDIDIGGIITLELGGELLIVRDLGMTLKRGGDIISFRHLGVFLPSLLALEMDQLRMVEKMVW